MALKEELASFSPVFMIMVFCFCIKFIQLWEWMWPNLVVRHFVRWILYSIFFQLTKKKTTLFNAPKQNVTISAVLHVNLIVQTFTSTPGLIFIQNSYLSVIKKLMRWSTARRIRKRKRTEQIRALSWWVKNNVLVSCSKS